MASRDPEHPRNDLRCEPSKDRCPGGDALLAHQVFRCSGPWPGTSHGREPVQLLGEPGHRGGCFLTVEDRPAAVATISRRACFAVAWGNPEITGYEIAPSKSRTHCQERLELQVWPAATTPSPDRARAAP